MISLDALRRRARATPDKPAIWTANSVAGLTYAELDDRADRIAALFRQVGLTEGQTIALLLENGPEVLAIWWGARRAGLYYVPLSTRLLHDELDYIVRDSAAALLVASLGQAEPARALDLPHLLLDESFTGRLATLCVAIEPAGVVGRELVYSSGTTGRPRGVKRPMARACEVAGLPPLERQIRAMCGFDEETVYLSVSPLYHSTGRFTMRVIEAGGTVVILPKFDAAAALEAIERHRITHSQWVPTMFARLLALPHGERCRHDLSSHRVALHAAAPCPPAVKRAMIDWWGPILGEYYGGTENAGVTFITTEEWLERPGSVGRSISGAIHILAEDGSERELPTGEIGLVYFEGGLPFAYLHDEAPSTTARGYSTYGDLGHVDEAGYLFLSDRRSDLIISGGVNIYPREVELILESHPQVRECAVIGLPDPEYGQRVHAVIVAKGQTDPALASNLIGYCRERLSGFKCPRTISFIDELPRNEVDKLLKRELRARFG